jgi:glycosyltransferase involved in cell wall biosynthesis/ribosomal protein S18 acetylase RimI-like enzyme
MAASPGQDRHEQAGVRPSVSVVVPVYNGAASLAEVVRRTEAAMAEWTERLEIVLVNDGSADRSWQQIEDLAATHPEVRGVDLARNFGQHNALLVGIREANNEICVTIDDDLQNPPEEIPKLLEALTPGYDVVYGEPIEKKHGLHRRLVSSFRAFRTRLRDGFADYTGPDVSIDALLTWQTDRFRSVQVRHAERVQGRSNYSLPKLVKHALTMITAFSTRPLRLATTLGFFVILFGVAVLVYVIGRTAIEQDSVPGFPFLASIISIFSGTQLFAIGVIGEYLARVHVRVMARPSYSVRARTASHATTIASGTRREGDEPLCRRLKWDSTFWGFPVARVNGDRLDREQAFEVTSWCDEEGIRCTYLLAPADDAGSAEAAESAGFLPVDTRMTLERQAAPVPAPQAGIVIRGGRERDAEPVRTLAVASHTDTRFHFDPNFPRQRAAELYAVWVGRGFDEDSRHLLVAERDDRLLGYVLVGDDPRTIDLIAVERSARGQGVGGALLAAAIGERPEEPISVVTQARNVGALRLYQRLGFTITSTEVWYHRWR